MAREIDKLSARAVATQTKPGRHSDGGGLYLIVDPSGAKRWLFIYRRDGKQKEMGLGGLLSVSLAETRRRRNDARKLLAAGLDPIAEKRRAERADGEVVTFGACADELIAELSKGSRNERHAVQWGTTLKTYAAQLRPKPIDAIGTDDVLSVLQPIWTTKSETASRVRGRIERVLDAARARGLRTGENPARWRGHLDQLLSKRRKLTRGHHAALPFAEVPAFIADLRKRRASSALALEFTILTAARIGEVLGCRWGEIDRERKIWTVPKDRMKAGREHRVPLSDRTLEILAAAETVRRGEFVFASHRADRPLSNMVFDALLTRMGVKATTHGFRSSFRDWAGEMTAFPREVAEAALAHAVGDATELAYRRGDALEKRRTLMNAWADFLEKGASKNPGTVVPLRRA
ncbi:tyrosine-type recombinase/integrase [Methylobacterium currus]|uniref:tyrosine-type recombinase/integrase n=1 Tax=Methylobacterium currus TaxID=2051553 RepID=UPI001E45AFE0|nr:site-specific integrase [Methylobacterium currus]UHC19447.1 tyrosine-type recombinase/integrase [Methylobacterium currus]